MPLQITSLVPPQTVGVRKEEVDDASVDSDLLLSRKPSFMQDIRVRMTHKLLTKKQREFVMER